MSLDAKGAAALALHRFGFGPRAGSIAAIASDPRGALLAELDKPGTGRSSAAELMTAAQSSTRGVQLPPGAAGAPIAQKQAADEQRHAPACRWKAMEAKPRAAMARRSRRAERDPAADLLPRGEGAARCRDRRRDRIRRAAGLVLVEPFLRLGRRAVNMAGGYEREAIRAHVLGRFADMLLAVDEPSGDAVLSRQLALDRARTRSRA